MENKEKIVNDKDFIELKFTGYVDGKVFDSNIPEDLKTISEKEKPKETLIVVGEKMVIQGLDNALIGKVMGKEYQIDVPYKIGFGKRNRELVKTIPLKVFTEKKVNPRPGSSFFLDNQLARVITVSGARVLTDFNNPLAGKDLKYKFTVLRKLTDIKEKANTLFQYFFKFIPDFKVDKKIIVEGPAILENFVKQHSKKFNELLGKDLGFKLKEINKEKKSPNTENENSKKINKEL